MSLGLIYKNAAHIFDEVEKKTPYLEYPFFLHDLEESVRAIILL